MGYGSHVWDAAGVDAYGHGTDLGKGAGVAGATEEEEPCYGDEQHRHKAAKESFDGFARRPLREAAGYEHERDGEWDADIAHHVVEVEQLAVVEPRCEVGYQKTNHVEHSHRADLVYPAPATGQEHDEGRRAKEVYQIGYDMDDGLNI